MEDSRINFLGEDYTITTPERRLYRTMRVGGLHDIESFLNAYQDTMGNFSYVHVDFIGRSTIAVEQYFSGVKVGITEDLALVIPGHAFDLSRKELFCLTVEGIEQLIREYKK